MRDHGELLSRLNLNFSGVSLSQALIVGVEHDLSPVVGGEKAQNALDSLSRRHFESPPENPFSVHGSSVPGPQNGHINRRGGPARLPDDVQGGGGEPGPPRPR